MLNGDYQPDGGQYLIDGKEVHFNSPREAINAGIGIIYQERQIVPYLTVAENIFMENIPVNKAKFIDYQKLNNDTQKIIDEFKLPIKATDRVNNLSVAYQQMVEIMKTYRRNPKIIAFDEPTASLSDAEIESLFKIIGDLKKKGLIILYVSHRITSYNVCYTKLLRSLSLNWARRVSAPWWSRAATRRSSTPAPSLPPRACPSGCR